MPVDYLNISRAQDIKDPKQRRLYRCLEFLPGFFSLGTLILTFSLSWLAPVAVAIFIIIFDFFWLLRIAYLSFHQLFSYRQMKKNLKTDWIGKLEKLKNRNWRDIYHLIVLPVYKEGLEIVRPTIQSLKEAVYPKEKIIVVLALEERAGEPVQDTARQIEEEYGKLFFKLLITTHPKDVPGEIAGKGSNQAFAINQVKEKIFDKFSIPYENIIISGFDVDTRPYPQYFACLTWNYLTDKNPLRTSYQPVPIYNNNIWQAPAFSRVISNSGTFWQMMQQERSEQLVTYSSHAMSFKACLQVGYPKNIVSDDSRIFWKSYFFYDGNYKAVPLYYPVSMDAVMAKNLCKTAINQYKQQRRWAWGCVEIPYIIFNFLKNKKIPLREKIRHTFVVLDGFWSWGVSSLIIFFLGWLPLILGGEKFQTTMLSYNLPRLTSNIMMAAMIGMMVSAIISFLILPPRPKNYSIWNNLFMILQWFLLPITLIVFGAFPALDAQIRLILGKYMGFWPTEKVRR